MEEKTQVDKWLHILKNNKIIAVIVIVFLISLASLKWGNEFLKFKTNYSSEKEVINSETAKNKSNQQEKYKPTETTKKTEENNIKDTKLKPTYTAIISGRLIDSKGTGIFQGVITSEDGKKVLTDENGYFKLEFEKRPQQLKVKILYKKEGFGNKERYVGVNQKNIILRL